MNDDGMCDFRRFGYIVGFLVATIVACGCLEPAVLAARAGERVRPPSIGATKWMWGALGDWVEGACLIWHDARFLLGSER